MNVDSAPVGDALDLTSNGVWAHFAPTGQPLLSFLEALNRVDCWAVDYREMEPPAQALAIRRYLQAVQRVVEASWPALHRAPEQFVVMLAQLTAARCLYLVRVVAERNPALLASVGGVLEQEADEPPSIAVVRRRVEAFSKAKRLAAIFSGKRLARITRIMRTYADV